MRERYQPLACLHEKASKVYTYLPLTRHGTEASRDTDDEGIKLSKVAGSEDGVVGFRGRIHLGQDLLWESLSDPGN